jgi:hypothetical protein
MCDRYFKILIQEMNIKVDTGFINALLDLFIATDTLPREQEVSRKNFNHFRRHKLIHAGMKKLCEIQSNLFCHLLMVICLMRSEEEVS